MKPLGDLLVEANAISSSQLEDALKIQSEQLGKPLGEILLSLGFITEKELMKAFEYQFRIPFYDLSAIEIAPEMAQYVSSETAAQYTLAPLYFEDNNLVVAVTDPMNFQAIDDVRLQSKHQVTTVLATKSDINRALVKLYEKSQTKEAVEDLNNEYNLEDIEQLSAEINESVDHAPVVRLVNLIINQAIIARASDIHIEPQEDVVRVRFRIDGELHDQLKISKTAHPAIVTRIKILGNMDIAEKRIPQDGRVQTVFNNTKIDLRLSILPTTSGEKIVIRILGGTGTILTRRTLGFTQQNSELFDEILKSPNGIILVSGPTGSGKSTTLYTVLNELNKPAINVITVEDPVEYRLEGINQVQVNPKAGLTFAAGLRSILRQDPDVIMIGEIRDSETAEIAVRASITGHLVLSTIHTNDSAATITRLVDMGVQPFLVSAALVGVVAQRLVRRICPKCKVSYPAEPVHQKLLDIDEPVEIFKGVGCPDCDNTGYKGRIAIHEVLLMNSELRIAIDNQAKADELRAIAARHGTKTLRQSCGELVLQGITAIDELIKVTYSK